MRFKCKRDLSLYIVWYFHPPISQLFHISSLLWRRLENTYHKKKKKEDRELQLNCTFIPYDYQSHHFPKIDPSAGLLSFSHSRNADTLWHDYYHIQSILVILTIIVLASNGMETYGKSKYHSLLLVFRDEANKACFKRILFLTTTLKKKAISPLRIDNS